MRYLPSLVVGLLALFSSSLLAQTAIPVRLASADNIEDLFRPHIVAANVNVVSLEHQAFDLINKKRLENGLQPLVWNAELEAVAKMHSQNMAQYQFFSHKGLDNKYVSDRALAAHIVGWRSIGENIAVNRGYSDPAGFAIELWLESAGHRRNLLDSGWKESAIGVAMSPDGSFYFTQVFLTRR
jgi:uncharacterized protein YkwD